MDVTLLLSLLWKKSLLRQARSRVQCSPVRGLHECFFPWFFVPWVTAGWFHNVGKFNSKVIVSMRWKTSGLSFAEHILEMYGNKEMSLRWRALVMRVMDSVRWVIFPFPSIHSSAASTLFKFDEFDAKFLCSRKFLSAPKLISTVRGDTWFECNINVSRIRGLLWGLNFYSP